MFYAIWQLSLLSFWKKWVERYYFSRNTRLKILFHPCPFLYKKIHPVIFFSFHPISFPFIFFSLKWNFDRRDKRERERGIVKERLTDAWWSSKSGFVTSSFHLSLQKSISQRGTKKISHFDRYHTFTSVIQGNNKIVSNQIVREMKFRKEFNPSFRDCFNFKKRNPWVQFNNISSWIRLSFLRS